MYTLQKLRDPSKWCTRSQAGRAHQTLENIVFASRHYTSNNGYEILGDGWASRGEAEGTAIPGAGRVCEPKRGGGNGDTGRWAGIALPPGAPGDGPVCVARLLAEGSLSLLQAHTRPLSSPRWQYILHVKDRALK